MNESQHTPYEMIARMIEHVDALRAALISLHDAVNRLDGGIDAAKAAGDSAALLRLARERTVVAERIAAMFGMF